jgi:glycosyltransferase involved in cell wall biosynthesis
MKIVHVEDFIHPDAGYQVNLLARLQKVDGHEVSIVTGEMDKMPDFLTGFFGTDGIEERDARFLHENGVPIRRVPLLGFYSGRAIMYPFRLFRAVAKEKPDVVFVHGEDTLTGILFILLSRWLPYPIVLDCHMLEMASLNRFRNYFRWFYQRFITPVILSRNIPLIRVVDSDYVQKCLGIPLSHTDLLSFGTDTLHFSPDADKRRPKRAELGLSQDAFVVLYAGKLDEHKGGKFLASAIREKFPTPPNGRELQFLIVGNSVGEYGEDVEKGLASSENQIKRLPTQRYFDLAGFYQAADLVIFPKQCSMSFFEAQSCGCPILFEANEINSQRSQFGNAVTFTGGDVADFRRKLVELISMPDATYDTYRSNAREYVLDNYDYLPIARQFTAVLERALAARNAQLHPA